MAVTDTTAELTRRPWVIRCLGALIVCLGLYALAQNAAIFAHNAGLQPDAGRLGLFIGAAADPGWERVAHVDRDGAVARAGMKVGDEVKFAWADLPSKAFRAGEKVPVKVRSGGAERNLVLTAVPIRPGDVSSGSVRLTQIEFALSTILPVLFGLFIVARSRGRLLVLLLGLCLVGKGGGYLAETPFWFTTAAGVRAGISMGMLIGGFGALAGLAFLMTFGRHGGQRLSRADAGVLLAYAAYLTVTSWATVVSPGPLTGWTPVAGAVVSAVYVALAWTRCSPAARPRFLWLLVGVALLEMPPGLIVLAGKIAPAWQDAAPQGLLQLIVSSLIAPLVLAYAILRHRVLDLGFAINRTLVYAVVSAMLLAGFGLVEWGAEHLLPASVRESSVVIDALLAVAVFLAFHRVRDFAEHLIEGLFFRRWQEAEAGLRRFVREAAFVTRAPALAAGLCTALSRYVDGAGAALFLRAPDGNFALAAGGAPNGPETLNADDPALLAIRADPRTISPLPAPSALRAALIAPMLHRNEVTGVVLLEAKSSGADYRPDEIELIGWAARQVGLDLHALELEALQLRLAAVEAEKQRETAVLTARLEGLLAGRAIG